MFTPLCQDPHYAKVQKYEERKIGLQFFICFATNVVDHYVKRIKMLHGCPFEGRPNRVWPSKPFLPKWVGWPCPVRSAPKRTPVQDFNSLSIMFYCIMSRTHHNIGDLFCPITSLDFRTVWRGSSKCCVLREEGLSPITKAKVLGGLGTI